MEINPKVIQWFEGRGIGPETVSHMEIYSARRCHTGGEVLPDAAGNIIVFPFIESGRVVAEKYRTADKRFWQRKNGRKTFYNSDVLDDPSLSKGIAALVITEGEMDCLAAIESGHPFTVSVPDGAPPARDANGNLIPVPDGTGDIDPATDDKFRCVFNNLDRLNKVKRIVIAADADEPGRRLAAELVRRLGRVRCRFVTYPDGCKDLDDVLMRHGRDAVLRVIADAQPYPVTGLYRWSELPREPNIQTASTGWGRLDGYWRLFYPSLVVIAGAAGSGKTTFVNQLAAQVAKATGWHVGIASFEMRIDPFVSDVLMATYLRKPKGEWHLDDIASADEFLERQFSFINPAQPFGLINREPVEAPHDIDWVIERAEAAVIRYGMRLLVIDPWNEIEHCRRRDESLTEYTGRAIRSLKLFSHNYDCAVIVVAHPTKSGADKAPDKLTLYDISDSAHFANKADHGIVIGRRGNGEGDFTSAIMVRKVRYQEITGKPGVVDLTFDKSMGLFSQ